MRVKHDTEWPSTSLQQCKDREMYLFRPLSLSNVAYDKQPSFAFISLVIKFTSIVCAADQNICTEEGI